MIKYSKKDIFVNNLKLHTEAFGNYSNPACILIAGKMSTAKFWSNTFCQYLAKQGFFTIRYDHRDVGESSEFDLHRSSYSLLDLAKDVILIMDSYSIKKANFVGFSMGAWICQLLGINYPERIFNFALISSSPIETTEQTDTPPTIEEQEILDKTSDVFLSIMDGKTLEETAQNYLILWRHLNAEIPLDEEMAKEFALDFLGRTKNKNATNHELVIQDFFANKKDLNAIQKISQPTLVIHGDKDPVHLPREGKEVAKAIPKAELVMIEGMGHAFFNRALEEKIVKLIVDHFKKYLI